MKRFLVTGGAGFIGSNLVIELVGRGYQVRVLDNLSGGHLGNLEPVIDRVEFIQGDLRNPDDVRAAVSGVDVVFHQAAMTSVPESVEDPVTNAEVNITGTLNLFVLARQAGVRRVVYASSSAVYGNSEELPKAEAMSPAPVSPYGVSKLANEIYADVLSELYGLETVGLRYFNVYGPRQNPNSAYAAVIPRFIFSMLKGQPPVVFGDGLQTRDFVFVKDVVEANILAAEVPEAKGRVFNIGSGTQVTLLELIEHIGAALGVSVSPKFDKPRPGDVKHSVADISRARMVLGFSPRFTLEQGIRETVEWFRRGGEGS